MECLAPPVLSVPKGKWLCPKCLTAPEPDFGFEEGRLHTLKSFKEMADRFKLDWFKKFSDDKGTVAAIAEDDVEREFWRLVASPFEHVEVEYGADVHSSKHGRYRVVGHPIMHWRRPSHAPGVLAALALATCTARTQWIPFLRAPAQQDLHYMPVESQQSAGVAGLGAFAHPNVRGLPCGTPSRNGSGRRSHPLLTLPAVMLAGAAVGGRPAATSPA